MPLPLEGIRVLDWTIWQQGPICTSMLADMGADVIKIEQTGVGDPGRYLVAAGGAETKRANWYFESHNRNKRGITLDFAKPEGREVLYELAKQSDVFVQNFRKGVAARLGLDYATLRAHNPKLIYASATGYGPLGAESGEPSFDHLGLARSGIMLAAGEPDMPPLGIAGGIADQMGGAMLAYGVMTALFARERSGLGQEVNGSHLGSMLFLQGLSVSMKLMAGVAMPRSFRARAFNPLWNHYRCADGKWIAFAMLQSDRYWPDFARVIGRPELAADARFENLRVRAANAAECVALIDAAFASEAARRVDPHPERGPGRLHLHDREQRGRPAERSAGARERLRRHARPPAARAHADGGRTGAALRDAGLRAHARARAGPAHRGDPDGRARLGLGPHRGAAREEGDLANADEPRDRPRASRARARRQWGEDQEGRRHPGLAGVHRPARAEEAAALFGALDWSAGYDYKTERFPPLSGESIVEHPTDRDFHRMAELVPVEVWTH